MKVPRKEIAELVVNRLKAGQSPKKLAKEIAAYMLSEKRSNEVYSLMRDVMALRAEHGLVEVQAATAHEFSDSLKREVDKAVKSIRPGTKQVILDQRYDPVLIGGIKLNVINQQADLSLRAKLNRFKQLTSQRGA